MKIRTEADFDHLLRGAKLLAITAAWSELGLWDRLAERDGPVDLDELPGDTRALSIAAAVLAHAGLLDGGGRRWTLSPVAREMRARGELPTARNLGWLVDLSKMSEVLREGGPVKGPDGAPKVARGGVNPDDPQAAREFLDMLHRRSADSAEATASWLALRLEQGGHVLDVGGGHGRYAEAMLDRGYQATLFDLPLVVDIARERHGDRMTYRAGDFHQDDFGGPYDAALVSNIVHGESERANAALVRRLGGALRPGGWLVLKDMFLDELGREPESAALFGATMLYYTASGRSYTLKEATRWCREGGFEEPDVVSTESYSLVFARKAA